jgi:ribonuclease HI
MITAALNITPFTLELNPFQSGSESSSGGHNNVSISTKVPEGVEISTRHVVGLYWFPGHAGVRGNEIADKLARDGSVQVGPEPSLGKP